VVLRLSKMGHVLLFVESEFAEGWSVSWLSAAAAFLCGLAGGSNGRSRAPRRKYTGKASGCQGFA
jgi:hypothetical protein